MSRSIAFIAVSGFAFAFVGTIGSVLEATCQNRAAAAPTYHSVPSGVPAEGSGCTNCDSYVDTWTSSDDCVDQSGKNCVLQQNSVPVTRQAYECVNGVCQPKGEPYELSNRRAQYVTQNCPGFPN